MSPLTPAIRAKASVDIGAAASVAEAIKKAGCVCVCVCLWQWRAMVTVLGVRKLRELSPFL